MSYCRRSIRGFLLALLLLTPHAGLVALAAASPADGASSSCGQKCCRAKKRCCCRAKSPARAGASSWSARTCPPACGQTLAGSFAQAFLAAIVSLYLFVWLFRVAPFVASFAALPASPLAFALYGRPPPAPALSAV